jgi:hypothetical protein
MMKSLKKYIVWIALLITVCVCWWFSEQDTMVDDESLPTMVRTKHPSVTAAPLPVQLPNKLVSTRQQIVELPRNIFLPYMPPQAAEEEDIQPEAQMPANPFTYAGKLFGENGLIVFLTDGMQNHAVKAGEIINENWRIKSITPPELMLEYVPLGLVTTMQIGAVN